MYYVSVRATRMRSSYHPARRRRTAGPLRDAALSTGNGYCHDVPIACGSAYLASSIQTAAGVGFEIVQDSVRRNLRCHYGMHVIASHVGRQQTPAALRAHLLNGFQYSLATDLVQVIGRLTHSLPVRVGPGRILFQNRRSRNIMRGIDRTGFTAVEVATIAGKGDQVCQGIFSNTNAP